MILAADVVTEARSWLRTKFLHQGRTKGHGCDCGGLVGGVGVCAGVLPADFWSTFDQLFGGYSRQPSSGQLQRVCEAFMTRVDDGPKLADVLLMHFATEPQHLAIVADYRHGGLSVIHALTAARMVVEHRLTTEWLRRVDAVYRLPGVVQ